MNFLYDVAVAWRIYPGISKRPLIHSDNKLELAKVCLASFLKSVKGLKVSYYFILDGCPKEYSEMIEFLFNGEKKSVIETSSIGNLATFAKQVEILTNQRDANVVYFAEDDYLYMPGEFSKMHELITSNKDVDFVTCYLHNDTFTHNIHKHARQVKYFAKKLWLTSNSTCLTFMTTTEILQKTKKIFLTYSKGNNDCALWLVLTKTHIYNPITYLKYLLTSRENLGILKRAVKYSFLYFFSPRKYKLWMPFPAIGTHLESGSESPGINWLEIGRESTK